MSRRFISVFFVLFIISGREGRRRSWISILCSRTLYIATMRMFEVSGERGQLVASVFCVDDLVT